ncbi:MAG: zinc metallopeptidase [Kiritimatiellae bacterium]|nr:zinc metallopeptidase [Kiritimatiellia bacterium]MBP5320951.1 zinc metallopeptidase [Kiritimatiellia bacterium]
MRFDPLYMMMLLPCMALAAFASWRVKSTFAKYAKINAYSGYTGARAAKLMLSRNGINDVAIERISGFLSDHYDPTKKVLRLSPDVFSGTSLSAIGVACHEAGHALQHAQAYAPLHLRSALVPITNLSSNLSVWVFFAGLLLQLKPLLIAGCVLFAVGLLFALVTLPVEWDASARAKRELTLMNVVSPDQADAAGKVLNAAFLTYLAAAFTSLMTLLYYLMRAGLLGGRSRD